jgi:hypothetical protein
VDEFLATTAIALLRRSGWGSIQMLGIGLGISGRIDLAFPNTTGTNVSQYGSSFTVTANSVCLNGARHLEDY